MFINVVKTYSWNLCEDLEGTSVEAELYSGNWQARAYTDEDTESVTFETPDNTLHFDDDGCEPVLKATIMKKNNILAYTRPEYTGIIRRLQQLRHAGKLKVGVLHFRSHIFSIIRRGQLNYSIIGECGNTLAELSTLEQKISLFVKEEEVELRDILLLHLLMCGVTYKALYLGQEPLFKECL